MSNDTNIVMMSGTTGADAVLKYTQQNLPVLNFSFTCQEEYNGKKSYFWMDCVFFGKEAELISPVLKKGVKVIVQGKFQKNSYQGKDGLKKEKVQIVARTVNVCQNLISYEAPVTQKQVQHNQALMEEEENLDLPF